MALIKAEPGDRWGNLTYRLSARNFGPIMATAATHTVATVHEIVDYDLINAGKQSITLLPGGALEQAIGAKQTWVMMDLLSKKGESKVVAQCTYPLTGMACVKRIYLDLATLQCTPQGLKLIDMVAGLGHAELEKLIGLPIAV